jgi:hypothetical protein
MQDELTMIGRERWRALAGEADRQRRARAVVRGPRESFRQRVATVLVALAARLAPAAHQAPCPTIACRGSGGAETAGGERTLRLPDHVSLYQGSGRISMN